MEADGHNNCDAPLVGIANNDGEKRPASAGNSGEQQQVPDAAVVNPPPAITKSPEHREHRNGDRRKEEDVPPMPNPGGADGTPPAATPADGSSAAALVVHPSVIVVLVLAAAAMGGFASYHFLPAAGWMWTMATTGRWHRLNQYEKTAGLRGNATAAVDLLRHPSWTKVNDGLVRCLPSVNDTKDVDIRSFFDDAHVQTAGAIDINNAMNRYLYMAIMNAVILGERLREDSSSKSWEVGKRIGRRQVKTYLDLLLNTMNEVEITTMDSSASHFTEMNQYLHLTMVQTSVLVEKYPNDTVPKKKTDTEIIEELKVELAQREEEIRSLRVRVEEMKVTITHIEVKLESKVAEVVSLHSKCDLCSTQLKDCQAAAAAAKGLDNRGLGKMKPRPHDDLHNDAGHFDARGQFRR
ncbi:hypothetical protein BS78_09G030400 [Paspalum vaginatum]|nr:hypothetical protein BS78_09G030400 [Paspalum vaginatum]